MEENKYKLLKENAQELFILLNRYVNIKLLKDISFTGFIHSIDPISGSIVLLVPDDAGHKTVLIAGHAILNIIELVPSNETKPPQKKIGKPLSNEEVLCRKLKVMAWFKQNMLPVTESNGNIILGNVTVIPPYFQHNISTDNTVVALQIRRIIENMPEDFKPNE